LDETTMNSPKKTSEWAKRDNESISRKYRFPNLVVHSCEDLYIIDVEGNRYLDFTSGGQTSNLGHSPKHVIDAVKKQIDLTGLASFGWLPSEMRIRLAEKLRSIAPLSLRDSRVGFCNTGSEATELVLSLVRRYTKRNIVLCSFGCFHGQTSMGALSLNTSPHGRRYGVPNTPGIFFFPFPYCYRCLFNSNYPSCKFKCIEFLRYQFETKVIPPEEVAAIFMEPIQVHGGVIPVPEGYMQELRKLSQEYDILLVIDEVTTGFGRTGKMFGIENWNVEIDLIYMAKPIASGLNLAAIMGNKEIMNNFRGGGTFSGNPVAAAAGLANIETIESEKLLEKVTSLGKYFKSCLTDIAKKTSIVGDVRGEGFLLGLEIVKDKESKKPNPVETNRIISTLAIEGLLVFPAGVYDNVVRICPPLITPRDIIERSVTMLDKILQ
jgi:4-aminobutyrate aminotransferase/(S)-3-amino-2-methylpropionate transaminase